MRIQRGVLLTLLVVCLPGTAQETRGMIFGRVLDPQGSPTAGARVTVTNVDTNTSTPLATNDTGYYEASLLLPGNYQVSAEAVGFRTSIRKGIVLSVASRVEVDMNLELGSVSESVTVVAEAPLLDTASASSGRVIDNRTQSGLPISSSNITLFARMAPGVQSNGEVRVIGPGDQFSTSDYKIAGGVGGNEWSIDGGSNTGSGGRTVGYVAHSDEISEIKVETGGFDSSIGHSSGMVVAMMSKAGSNQFHGGASNSHDQARWNATPYFTRQLYYRRIAEAEAAGDTALANQLRNTPKQLSGRRNHYSAFLGGPVVIPGVFNGRDRLFFFFSFVGFRRIYPPNPINFNHTFPTLANRRGDFSQLLNVDAARYQIYDPLSVQPDPNRPGNYIRTPIPGNILPASRVVNPAYKFYERVLPTPNNDPTDPRKEPLINYLGVSIPWTAPYEAYTNRVDYKYSDQHRFYGRWTYDDYYLNSSDWAFQTEPGLMADRDRRHNIAAVVDWVYTRGASTVLDVSVSGNQYISPTYPPKIMNYKPSDVGLPKYLDDRAGDLHILPTMNFDGYNSVGRNVASINRFRSAALKADLAYIRGKHSLRGGIDFRRQYRVGGGGGNTSGNFNFSNTFTRRYDDSLAPAGSLGHSWAAFMMGMPSSMTLGATDSYVISNPYYGWHFQDNWRVTPKLNLNLGLRLEYERGPTERYDRWIGYFVSGTELPISRAAQAAYAANPLPERAAADVLVRGGPVYPGSQGVAREIRRNELMWLPRIAAAWQLNSRTVIRAGFGLFFDTLNASTETVNQQGYSRTTSTNITNDFGMNWLAGNPRNGVSPLTDPFPVRADGTRFDEPVRDKLGAMATAGRGFTFAGFDTRHARQRRWRAGVQRQIGASMLLEVAYTGSYSDRVYVTRNLNPLAQRFWADGLVRNNAVANDLNANVRNPFLLANFAALRSSDPLVYQDIGTQGFFTSTTIRKNQLLRPYPQASGLSQRNAPFGKVRTHDMQLSFERRFAKGFSLYFAYTRLRDEDRDVFLNEFDAAPSWRQSNNGRPHRFVLNGIWELPFGKGRSILRQGPLGRIVGGWQIGVAWEAQPGPLLDFGNLFYYGKIEEINTGTRTFDRWFNTANFERTAARAPAAYHRRVFPTRVEGLRADPTNAWNSNVLRAFKITERVTFQARLEALNVFNRTQFAAPVTDPLSTNFSAVTVVSQTNKRFLLISGRITF
ncbi:MAG: carboxypeptidase regulatory-like domain-containing protein [Acidobacteria bacterium]|nr:carboxypeptidase regulatory-like domain-containing protein [Acidobacteriota bacterium]